MMIWILYLPSYIGRHYLPLLLTALNVGTWMGLNCEFSAFPATIITLYVSKGVIIFLHLLCFVTIDLHHHLLEFNKYGIVERQDQMTSKSKTKKKKRRIQNPEFNRCFPTPWPQASPSSRCVVFVLSCLRVKLRNWPKKITLSMKVIM